MLFIINVLFSPSRFHHACKHLLSGCWYVTLLSVHRLLNCCSIHFWSKLVPTAVWSLWWGASDTVHVKPKKGTSSFFFSARVKHVLSVQKVTFLWPWICCVWHFYILTEEMPNSQQCLHSVIESKHFVLMSLGDITIYTYIFRPAHNFCSIHTKCWKSNLVSI